jgi:hypothetical protein
MVGYRRLYVEQFQSIRIPKLLVYINHHKHERKNGWIGHNEEENGGKDMHFKCIIYVSSNLLKESITEIIDYNDEQ